MEFQLLGGALIAEIAGTIAGFGSSSIFLPIASQFLTFHNALVLVAIYHIFGNVSRFSLFWKHRDRRVFWIFGIPSIIATVIGASLASQANPDFLKLILGIVLICFASYTLINTTFSIKPTKRLGRVGGAASGFTAGLIGTGGVLRGAFMTLFGLSKERYIATIASIALLVDFTRIPIYFANGLMDQSLLWMIPVLFVIAFIGSWIGKQIIQRIDEKVLRKIILGAIIIVSGLLAGQGFQGLQNANDKKIPQAIPMEYTVTGAKSVVLLRQSGVECSSYSAYAASKVLGIKIGSQETIRDSFWPKFSFGILPTTFKSFLIDNFRVFSLEKGDGIEPTMENLRFEISQGRVIILLVEHQSYQHYFTLLGYNTSSDEWYVYDSLAPRLDNSVYTQDLNGDDPGNYTINSQKLYNKRSRGGKYGLRERWGVGLSTKDS